MPRLSSRPVLLRALFVAALAAIGATLAGCHDFGDVTGSINGSPAQPTDDAKLRAYADEAGKRYERNPGEKTASIEYARALRALTPYSEAVAVIQTAAIKAPKDFEVLGEYGKPLADSGQLPQAKDVLSHAYTPDAPRWDVMSVQGTVADQNSATTRPQCNSITTAEKVAGRAKRAYQHGAFACLGRRQLPQAEQALRQAVASPKPTRACAATSLWCWGWKGNSAKAETVGQADLSPDAARANVEAVRQMISQNDSWRELRKPAKTTKTKAPAKAEDAG